MNVGTLSDGFVCNIDDGQQLSAIRALSGFVMNRAPIRTFQAPPGTVFWVWDNGRRRLTRPHHTEGL